MIKRSSNMRLMSRGWLLFMLLAAAVPGCKKKETPPTPQVTPLPQKTGQPQAAAPANIVQGKASSAKKPVGAVLPVQKQMSTSSRLRPPGTVSLDFTNRRDPFRPFVQAPATPPSGAGKIVKNRIKDPLPIQTVDTDKFIVTGIITGLKENSALVMDPSRKGYVVKQGMQIGNNGGYIKRITNTTVEVEETFRDDSGHMRKRLVKLTLIRKK